MASFPFPPRAPLNPHLRGNMNLLVPTSPLLPTAMPTSLPKPKIIFITIPHPDRIAIRQDTLRRVILIPNTGRAHNPRHGHGIIINPT